MLDVHYQGESEDHPGRLQATGLGRPLDAMAPSQGKNVAQLDRGTEWVEIMAPLAEWRLDIYSYICSDIIQGYRGKKELTLAGIEL